jgi:chromatin structure-remodeling complex subunit RSC1/2
MPIGPAHKTAIEQVINVITLTKAPRGKRILCEMFLDLVDREELPEYYEVMPL